MLAVLGIIVASVLFLVLAESYIDKCEPNEDVKLALRYLLKHKVSLSEYELFYSKDKQVDFIPDKIDMFWFLYDFLGNPRLKKYLYTDDENKYTQYNIFIKYKKYYSKVVITCVNKKSFISIEPCDKLAYKNKAKLFKI